MGPAVISDAFTLKVMFPVEQRIDVVGDAFGVGQASGADGSAGQPTITGIDDGATTRAKAFQVGLRGRMFPHGGIHRGSDNDATRESEIKRRQKVVRETVREFSDEIGGCGGNDESVIALRDGDVLDGAGQSFVRARVGEQAGDDLTSGQSCKGERPNELPGRACHDNLNEVSALLQRAYEFRGLVRRDSSADTQDNAHARFIPVGSAALAAEFRPNREPSRGGLLPWRGRWAFYSRPEARYADRSGVGARAWRRR